jgi:nucleoporin NUP82
VTFCNITLGYGLLALASSHQLAAIELDFRMTESATDQPASPELSLKEPSAEDERDAYSLLLAKPVDFPQLISSIRQPGNYDPRDLIRKLPEYKKPLQTVSPDHLRVLGEITSQVQARTRAIRAASQAIENRIDLELQELQRQLKLLKDCSTRITQLRKSTTRERTERMLDTQGVLGERLDKVSVAMWEEYRPQIGEAERKWFDELDRLKSRVRGGGNQHGKGLAGREQLVGQGPSLRYCQLMTREKLQEQLAAIKPVVKSLRNPDEESDAVNGEYGSKQIRPLEIALSARSDEIRKLLRRMETLTFRVDAAGVEENEGDAER